MNSIVLEALLKLLAAAIQEAPEIIQLVEDMLSGAKQNLPPLRPELEEKSKELDEKLHLSKIAP